MVDLIKTLLSRFPAAVVLQLSVTLPVAYVVASFWTVDFWMVVSVAAIPILAWHGFIKPHRETIIEQRARQEQLRRQAIQNAHRAVYAAHEASTSTIDGVLNFTLAGPHYETLMTARIATTAVAPFINNPPPLLEEAVSRTHLEEWLVVLRNALL